MNRLTIINFINPNWFKQITEFLCEHPKYVKLIPIVALDEYPNGFDKNPHESDENVPLNIFETLIYGLAYANVDIDYGKIQYLLLIKHLRQFKVQQIDVFHMEINNLKEVCQCFMIWKIQQRRN